jgi:hypothetical protein
MVLISSSSWTRKFFISPNRSLLNGQMNEWACCVSCSELEAPALLPSWGHAYLPFSTPQKCSFTQVTLSTFFLPKSKISSLTKIYFRDHGEHICAGINWLSLFITWTTPPVPASSGRLSVITSAGWHRLRRLASLPHPFGLKLPRCSTFNNYSRYLMKTFLFLFPLGKKCSFPPPQLWVYS